MRLKSGRGVGECGSGRHLYGELLKPCPTKFWIPAALEVTIISKEVLVRRPAPPGIRHFWANGHNTGGGVFEGLLPSHSLHYTTPHSARTHAR